MTAGTESVAAAAGDRRWLWAGLVAILSAALAAISVLPGTLLVGLHEGDAVHLTEIVVRMAEGEWPHVDFSTPLGILTAAPMAAVMRAGVDNWFVWGQVIAAAVTLPAALWAAYGRYPALPATLFSGAVMLLMLALTYGGDELSQSASLHYNRWGWAWMLIAFGAALAPPARASRQADWADAAVIGGAILALGLLKASYVLAVVPAVVAALAARQGWVALGGGVAIGLAGCAFVTIVAPSAYWPAYVADLLQVARSETRSWPGPPPVELVGTPAMIVQVGLVLGAVVLLRRAGGAAAAQGPALLLFGAGAVYATAQNWNNDALWVWGLAPLLLGLGTLAGGALVRSMTLVAAGLGASEGAQIVNALISPMRMLASETEDYVPILANHPSGAGIQMVADRRNLVEVDVPWQRIVPSVPVSATVGNEDEEMNLPVGVGRDVGESDCAIGTGWATQSRIQAEEIGALGFGESRIFVADYMPSLWLFGGGERVPGGSPWYYGLPPGFADVDLVTVLFCAASERARRAALEELAAEGVVLNEVARTDIQVIYEVVR